MNGIICDSRAKADAYQAAVSAKLGYPIDGQETGGGFHATRAEGRTNHLVGVLKHPTLSQWAYLDDFAIGDDPTIGTRVVVARPVGATVQTLDATWFPGGPGDGSPSSSSPALR